MEDARGLVLVVEDEPAISDLVRRYLVAAGFGVHLEIGVAGALDAVRRLRPAAVLLDVRHLGKAKILERLPLITEVARTFAGVFAVTAPIPVCPSVHYTMGGVQTDVSCEPPLTGLFAAGECSSVG